MFVGVLGAVLTGGIILAFLGYAMVWIEYHQRKGMAEKDIPPKYLVAIIVPMLINIACLWVTFYGHH